MTGHREAIALLSTMIEEILDEYEAGGTPKLWRQLSRTWRRAEAARVARHKSKWREDYVQLGMLIERGRSQADREAELLNLFERRRKQVDSETRRRSSEANTLTAEEAAVFLRGLGEAVRRHVLDPTKTDEEKLIAIENDMVAIAYRYGVSDGAGGNADAE